MTKRWKFDILANELEGVQHMPKPYARFCHNLIRKHKLKTGLEIGTNLGRSAAFLGNAVGPNGRIITLEKKDDNEAEARLQRLGLNNVQVVRHPSGAEWVCKYMLERQMSFDFAFIDGCHDFKHVLVDFELAKRLVRPGGWIIFDDLPWTHKMLFKSRPEVRDRLIKNSGIDYVESEQIKAVWDHVVTRDPAVANVVHHSRWFAAVQLEVPKKQRITMSKVRHPIHPVKRLPLIFSVFDKDDLVAPFIHHYAKQGVTDVHCCVYSQNLEQSVRKAADDAGLNSTIHRNNEVFDHIGRQDARLHNRVRETCVESGGWYVVADVDELHRVGIRTLAQSAAMADAEGATVVMGRLIDRITKHGNLPEVIEKTPLDEQFPYTAWLTSKVTQGCDSKVLLARQEIPIVSGHHAPPYGYGKIWRLRGQSHHYKWWGNLKERYEQRHQEMAALGTQEAGESERLVEHLTKHGGIDVKDLTLHPFINTWL